MEFAFIIVGFVSAASFILFQMKAPLTTNCLNEPIDPNNARQLGELIGLSRGSIPDAAVARAALQRFEQSHGHKPTVRDMGIVAGMMKVK